MSNVLIAELSRNSFTEFLYSSLDIGVVVSGEIKIDTGCTYTNIPLQSFGYSKDFCTDLKRKEVRLFLDENIKCSRSFGIESNRQEKLKPLNQMTEDELMSDTRLCFHHKGDLLLGSYKIREACFRVNYDRNSTALLGMNILRYLDFHCGLSKKTSENLLVGIAISQEDKSDYYRALEEHFGILSENVEDLANLVLKNEKIKDTSAGFRQVFESIKGYLRGDK